MKRRILTIGTGLLGAVAVIPAGGDRMTADEQSPADTCAFLPENSLSYPAPEKAPEKATEKSRGGMSHAEFEDAIARFRQAVDPLFAQRGLVLQLQADWDNPQVNAKATRDDQDRPIIQVFGGMARHPENTSDAFSLILCHEAGHFLGGAPKAFRGSSQRRSWSSVEGQADYFAAAKCARAVFADEAENRAAIIEASATELERLRPACESAQCVRIALAGRSASRIFAAVSGGNVRLEPEAADPSVVMQTYPGHPSAQCRLDTFIAGAACKVPWTIGFDDSDPDAGACVLSVPAGESAPDRIRVEGARPVCWFAPGDWLRLRGGRD